MSAINLMCLSIHDTVLQSNGINLKSVNWAQVNSDTFKTEAFLGEKLSPSDFRTLMPFILTAIFARGASFVDSLFVDNYLSTPFFEFAYRSIDKLSVLAENAAKYDFVSGWVAPSLVAFSKTELNLLVEAVDDWLASESHDVAWRNEIFELQRIVKMAVRDG